MTGFIRFANGRGFGDKYTAIALGQGQGPVAERLIAEASRTGNWVFLQNCHLAKSWMSGMEVTIKGLALPDAEVHEDFRLYLSSMPCDFFPIGVLQNAVKVTNEPPRGLRANVRASFASIDAQEFETNQSGLTYRKVIFGLCFFHANIQERKKFGPLGWNIRYDFSDTDRETTLANLAMFLEEGHGVIPWDALTYLIGEIYYGGRVTDHWDERTLAKVLKRFFGLYTLDDGFKYSESGIYFPAERDTLKQYVEYVSEFPLNDAPDIFGLHDNANTTYQTNEILALIGSVLSVQPRLVAVGEAKTPDEICFEIAEMIEGKLRTTLLDIDEAKEGTFHRDEHGQVASLSTVLKQEIERFNILLVKLWVALKDIKKAIKGLVVMDDVLEGIFNAFLNNQVPPSWSKASYPSLQPLSIWVNDLVGRTEFTQMWLVEGAPKSFWLSGFYFPQGFLTGTLQTHARAYNIPIDTLAYKFEVMPHYIDPMVADGPNSPKGVELPPIVDGVYVHGLFMEAMAWDDDKKMLCDPKVGQNVSDLPVMRMLPVPNFSPERDRPQDYLSPMYKTNVRAGLLSTTGHSTNFVVAAHLPTDKDPDFWVNRGSALLCQNVLTG